MVRRSASLLVVLAALAGVGCSQDGAVDVTWNFNGNEPASSGCGQHGVDSIVVSGQESGGDTVRVGTLCTTGARRIEVSSGTWTIQVSMFDFQSEPVNPGVADPFQTVNVSTDGVASVSVQLTPPPTCADHVDNDGDGRVDAADPDCMPGGTGVE